MSNNNRNNSNRRRGRGSNRSQGGGQSNRIDSRARGNAPQLLEKYRKLAHDASLNGDRVQAEYYLQFADHYFRVLADSRAPREGAAPRRDAEREQSEDFEEFEDDRGQRHQQEASSEREDGEQPAESEEANAPEPAENPFTRKKSARAPRERKERKGRAEQVAESDGEEPAAFDPSILPPSIARDEDDGEKPAPRRTRRPRSRGKDDDETLEAVS